MSKLFENPWYILKMQHLENAFEYDEKLSDEKAVSYIDAMLAFCLYKKTIPDEV